MAHSSRYTHRRDEAYDRLVDEARTTKSVEDRIQTCQEADRILVESVGVVPLLYGRDQLLIKPWVRNCLPSPTGYWFWKDVIIEPH